MIEWLLYVEAFSEHNINFTTSINRDDRGKLHHNVEVPHTTSLSDEQEFLCARFVEHAIKTEPKTAEVLARIASIGLLTEVVQDFVKPDTPVEASNLIVYLDAPVALELLGVSGKAARDNTRPIISELQRIGVNVRIFGQSIEELKSNLEAMLNNPRPTGPTAQALARGEVLKDYVVAVAKDPEPFLNEVGVNVAYRTLEQNPNEHAHFTAEHWREIYTALSFQQRDAARVHDSDITTLVMRQRHGIEDRDFFKTRFVVMTRNGLLAQLTRKRCLNMGLLSPNAVPPLVHRRVIAATMWLRTGLLDQDLEVPKRLLLANCERVLAIRPGVVEAVKRFTDALGDEEKTRQLDLLVSQDRSTQMLMDKTLGAQSVVTEENFTELFDEMLHPYIEDERKKGDKRVAEASAKGEERLAAMNQTLQDTLASESALSKSLGERAEEERAYIEALTKDVEKQLVLHRRNRKILGLVAAVVLVAPPLFASSSIAAWLSVAFAIVLAYLTITGSKLIGTKITPAEAKALLHSKANQRNLTPALDRIDVQWNGSEFRINDQTKVPASDLFDSSTERNRP